MLQALCVGHIIWVESSGSQVISLLPQYQQQLSSFWKRRSPQRSACQQAEAPQWTPVIMTVLPLPQVIERGARTDE